MKRRLFNLAATVSLVLCVATAAFWVSGYAWVFPSQIWQRTRPVMSTRYSFTVGPGSFAFDRVTPPSDPPPEAGDSLLGFGFVRCSAYARAQKGPNHLIGDVLSIFIPFWFIVLMTAALPVWRIFPLVRARFVIPTGHCRSCGYDLRATPDRCPECGAMAESAQSPA